MSNGIHDSLAQDLHRRICRQVQREEACVRLRQPVGADRQTRDTMSEIRGCKEASLHKPGLTRSMGTCPCPCPCTRTTCSHSQVYCILSIAGRKNVDFKGLRKVRRSRQTTSPPHKAQECPTVLLRKGLQRLQAVHARVSSGRCEATMKTKMKWPRCQICKPWD